jgi:predicted small integral membrane protein
MKVHTRTTIVALVLVSACNEWVHVETPQEALMRAKTGTIQVTKTDRTVLLLHDAAIVGDAWLGLTIATNSFAALFCETLPR